ncbi:DUF3293 domain-containing protein [Acidomonas methanolica]|uniref:DUF3293 domain-containing protein n=1 Tax=Acidomonas methanolica NBRC 104435 TaxID=1231351 RepID=A0A023D370_ACIMT|nr:DUF3293 domain-containing protein [Acidomonas methanolica]MBU2654444.1 DUF3293 domain-containing protein [Acidomonas methanolica]TCS28248.1 uncharacterized protein DUF3293 [Acidomonas methanolica]GAJ28618.1 hypothetical protein Amme_031_080 [Acidomonas methanolica NBRC 104435]GEK98965.1 hypothetical protein AME01nite_14640 [Acidomonas methanolica NBRC 104435]
MSGARAPTPRLAQAYRATLYAAPGLRVRIGRRPQGWPLPGREIVLLGACNPGGRLLPPGVNARRMAALRRCLHDVAWREGEGRLGHWAEPFLAAAMPLARAKSLARRFGQNAVVVLRRGQVARLVWLSATNF